MAGNKANPRIVLQPRDLHLLRELDLLRIIDREATKVVTPFQSTTRANTRLLALVHAGYLQRVAVGTVRGGHKYLYALTRLGAGAVGTTFRQIPWKTSAIVAGQPFLEHQLRLNELYLGLRYTSQPQGILVTTWRTFSQALDQRIRLIPDAYCEVASPIGVTAMFVEVDQGTESLRIWRRKIDQYLTLATSGTFNRLFPHPQFRVLVTAPSMRRLQTISRCIALKTTKVFWLTTHEHAAGTDVWSACWFRPGSHQSIQLF
jgi:hypothetical protein